MPFVYVEGPSLRIIRYSVQSPNTISIQAESSLADAFQSSEDVAFMTDRVAAVLITPTCSLEKSSNWTFAPIQLLSAEPDMVRNTLFSPIGYLQMFGLPSYEHFITEDSFIDFSHTVCLSKQLTPLTSRVLSIGRESSLRLGTKLANYHGRDWGYAEGEAVEESGFYRCRLCAASFGIQLDDRELKKGEKAPACKECSDRGKRASWAKLMQAKQKQLPFPSKFST